MLVFYNNYNKTVVVTNFNFSSSNLTYFIFRSIIIRLVASLVTLKLREIAIPLFLYTHIFMIANIGICNILHLNIS